MEKFNSESIIELTERFKTDADCEQYLADIKWCEGFRCKRCGHCDYVKGRKALDRRCQSCLFNESPTSQTIFHHIKFSLKKAFHICYRVSVSKKGMSSTELSRELSLRQKTCWAFKRKIQESMASSEVHPLIGNVDVDECAIGGLDEGAKGRSKGDKKLVSIAVEILKNGKIGRAYGVKINNYSSKELSKIFEKHISKEAQVRTDCWTGYIPIKEKRDIIQEYSNKGKKFPEMHIVIMNLKSWLRGIYHKCSESHMQAYINEFFYRFNRRSHTKTIFHNLLDRMLNLPPFPFKMFEN